MPCDEQRAGLVRVLLEINHLIWFVHISIVFWDDLMTCSGQNKNYVNRICTLTCPKAKKNKKLLIHKKTRQALCEKRVQNKQQTKDAASTFVEEVCAALVEKQMNQPQRINFSPQENKSSFRASLTASPVNNSSKLETITTEQSWQKRTRGINRSHCVGRRGETWRNFVTEAFNNQRRPVAQQLFFWELLFS